MIECYAIENHPHDSRVTIDPSGIVQTLSQRIGTGGGNAPIALIALQNDAVETEEAMSVYVIDSHPTDSRIKITDDTFPTITAHIAKVGADGPLLMIRRNND